MSEPLPDADPTVNSLPAEPPTKQQLWQQRLQRFHQSGLSARAFCAAEGIPLPTFYLWKRRLNADQPDDASATPPPFVPLRLLPETNAPLQLVLPSGIVLRIGPDCDPELLRRTLALLGVTPC